MRKYIGGCSSDRILAMSLFTKEGPTIAKEVASESTMFIIYTEHERRVDRFHICSGLNRKCKHASLGV
jgi:hypothetical protein